MQFRINARVLMFSADGITYTFGVVYIELLKEFNEGKGYTSWILSLMCGMILCLGNYTKLTAQGVVT